MNYFKELQQENEKLKKYCCKRNDCSGRLIHNNKLTDSEILTKFEKWLEEQINYWKQQEENWIKEGFMKFGGEANNKIIFKKCYDRLQEMKDEESKEFSTMKIEAGMYVRTKKGIAKVTDIDDLDNVAWTDRKDIYFGVIKDYISLEWKIYDDDTVLNVSHNIIDLIEINDIVQIKESIDNYSKSYFIGIDEKTTLQAMKERIENNNLILESVLTKEQFENNCYKIGG